MGVSYETDPQSNLGWFREQLAQLRQRVENAESALRTAQGRSGTVSGGLIVVTPHANNQAPTLVRIRGVVYLNFRITLGGAVAADGVVATLPAGFKPAGTTHMIVDGVRAGSGGWVFQGYWINPADGTIRLLQNGGASGDVCSALVPPFPAAS